MDVALLPLFNDGQIHDFPHKNKIYVPSFSSEQTQKQLTSLTRMEVSDLDVKPRLKLKATVNMISCVFAS